MINANQDEGHYVMNFAGLFDCAKLKAHGEAILAYNLSRNGPISNEEKMTVSSTITNATYDDSVQERLPILAPLNYAPFNNKTNDNKNGYIPITELHHIVDNKSKKGELYQINLLYIWKTMPRLELIYVYFFISLQC